MNAYIDRHNQVWVKINQTYYLAGGAMLSESIAALYFVAGESELAQ